ncbi:hypothetical protein HK105_204396 [Polyrhizophydium stewartii]|uniref:Vomeronasal type-1 receptor n=1 Tax=Polyrhizophydium stewartii TaxID=2732419 RepID=A0ABR4N8Z9_9FUNG
MCDGDQLVQRDNIAYSLGVLLCLSVQNLAKNAEQLIRSHSPGRVALAVASLCQALHTSLFLVQNSLRWISSCMWLSSGNDVLYYIFQILATAVLVERGTVLLPFPVGHVLRVAFTVAIIVGTAMNIYSSAIKTVLVSDLGWCVVSYDRNWNTRAKIVYVGIYLGIFLCFFSSVVNILVAFSSGNMSPNRTRMRRFVLDFSCRILLAVVVNLCSVLLSFYGFWGSGFYVQFALENYSMQVPSFALNYRA